MGERSCCGTLCSMPHEQWCQWIPEEETMKTCDVCGTKVRNAEVGHGECPNCFEGLLSDWEKRTKEIWGFK